MKKIGKLENVTIVTSEFAPSNGNVIWRDKDGNLKEAINGEWVPSPRFPQGGDDFPYEYACPDDFSVTVQYEDWENLEDEPHCEIHIDEIDIPENAKYFYCVNGRTGNYVENAYITVGSGKNTKMIDVFPLIDDNKFNGVEFHAWEDLETLIQQASPITVNFTDMLFIGEKKINE